MKHIVFIDTEVSEADNKAYDFGAVKENNEKLHTGSVKKFHDFISDAGFLCGHNIINHDSKYIDVPDEVKFIDTLYLSPLMFPDEPYHSLLKDDKLRTNELNNPLNDSLKAMTLFYDEVNAFNSLDEEMQFIYYTLLYKNSYFSAFFDYINFRKNNDAETVILHRFSDEICENAPLADYIYETPVELAYCLAQLSAEKKNSLIPKWVLINFPKVEYIMRGLRNTPCGHCSYCNEKLNPLHYLKKYFGYEKFRSYNNEPLQENAVKAAVNHKSLLAVFPTGGGKSLTFQIPALIAGETERGLTVVISPLQSLMKDQIDNLDNHGITEAVAINGLLSPIEKAEAIHRIESGIASVLYISPESLRSVTTERLLLSRHINRFVIDEAHCFSAWGQDFRVDYLYIGDFIKELQEKKGNNCRIPVSCFTATAKQKVISDIKDYFRNKLDIELELFTTTAARTNLHYQVLYKETDDEKYETLRTLIEQKCCPTIIYVSRTKRTRQIAEKLTKDGFSARAFNGKMDSSEKQKNQDAFIRDEVQIIVATSAFGMGVDKSNVQLVIHYDISDSLENYVQEAGRAGRNQSLQADCYVLFNDEDLDKHFMLLNQTKLSISEINQVWKAVKKLTKINPEVCRSPLEIARQAGWDENISEIETRVKTAIQALENAGYLKRGKNIPRVYATSILVKNMEEAVRRIDGSLHFSDDYEKTAAKRIIKSLISSKSIEKAGNTDAESRVDYLADRLGFKKSDIINAVQKMRESGILADEKDLTAYILKKDTANKSMILLHKFQELENFLFELLNNDIICINYKKINESAIENGIKSSSVNSIKTLLYYWTIRNYILKEQDYVSNTAKITIKYNIGEIKKQRLKSYKIAEFIISYLFERSKSDNAEYKEETLVGFSVLELMNKYNKNNSTQKVNKDDIEEALLFLSKIGALKIEGGFLVIYGGMQIKRIKDDRAYKIKDYRQLNEFYQQKIQQIHIVGEYANMMVKDYNKALQFVNDYFNMNYKKFMSHYFSGERAAQIKMNITPQKYKQLFGTLSPKQLEIVLDKTSPHIVISAGPGSGKTRVLVHKLASLMLMEDVKHEQLLMLTFSRAAVIEFKKRLHELIGNSANFVEIKTFHSYCFDLLGKTGNIKDSENIVRDAQRLIRSGDAVPGKITKTVLVIDEAQDMDRYEYALIETLMENNEEMRVIAVGDDDQNIYQFRGSDSKYLNALIKMHGAVQYSLLDNYRSSENVVKFANAFARKISSRMKSEDITAVSDTEGEVKLIRHESGNFETAVVNDVARSCHSGTVCILTNTNQEAMLVLGILQKRGIPAKLIQSSDGFDIYDIAEIRYFLNHLYAKRVSPIITEEDWNDSIDKLSKKYEKSSCISLILSILRTFSDANEKKYRTDLEMFLHESKTEDFYESEQGIITVSTMHKSKGREFDNVFMLVDSIKPDTDEQKRQLYVGMTRAKNMLHIHYSGNIFDRFAESATSAETDCRIYPRPSELILQLSHKDVYLDFFKNKKSTILTKIKSGSELEIKGKTLYAKIEGKHFPVLQFSKKADEEILKLTSSGYRPYKAVVRFICAWTGKEDTEETAIILPDIYFSDENT